MNTSLFIFFLLALLCVGLSITNYLNITILGNQTKLSGFKGNRSNFLQVDGESTVITTFDQFDESDYTDNALTVQAAPVKIQVLNDGGEKGGKYSTNPPCINIVNTESQSTFINFRINDTTSDSKTINDIHVFTSIDSTQIVTLSAGINTLSFVQYDILSPCLFNLTPYFYENSIIPIGTEGHYNLSSYGNYIMEPTPTGEDLNFFFSLPNVGSSGLYINFIFTGVNSYPIDSSKELRMRWGPPGILAPNSVIENYNSRQGIFTNGEEKQEIFGAFNTYNDANNILYCYCDSRRTLLGKNEGANTTVAGLIVKFSSVSTNNGYKWAVEIDNVYPMVEFQFKNDWSP